MKHIVVAVVVLSVVLPAGALTGDGTPLAEAGLDQEVERGATVLLDGTGSRDPDGEVVSYEWRIEAPSGATETPTNPSDPRTRFVASERGRYAVTLTVTDDEGYTASDTLYVDVARPTTPTPTSAPSTPSTPSRTSTSTPTTSTTPVTVTPTTTPVTNVSSGPAPVIRGPKLVTGTTPLRGSYTLSGAGADVDTVRWVADGTERGTGTRTTIDWSAGVHDLHAVVTYRNGTRRTARFPDGSTDVEADPRPTVSLANLSGLESVSGLASADDGFGNVETVTVSIDGVRTERRRADTGTVDDLQSDSLSFGFDWYNLELGREFTLTATAVDARGQRATVSRTVVARKAPEIVSARFVNGPVDSYHPRIAAERYTAHHVLRVDLNGYNASQLEVEQTPSPPASVIQLSDTSRTVQNNQLVIHSYWAGSSPSEDINYRIDSEVSILGHRDSAETAVAIFRVVPSPPELRLRMLNDGTAYVGSANGSRGGVVDFSEPIVIDAGDSFDPDGSELRFGWQLGAEPISSDNTTARLSGWDNGRLVVKDDYGLISRQSWDSTESFVPEVLSMEIASKPEGMAAGRGRTEGTTDEAFAADRTIEIRVTTQVVRFRRETADISIGAILDGPSGRITEWREVEHSSDRPAAGDQPGGSNAVYYEGTIEIRAGALAAESVRPDLVLYNEARPEHTRERTELPSVSVVDVDETVREDISVSDVRYAIRKPVESRVDVDSRREMNLRRSNGFTVEATRLRTTGYGIEKQVQIQEAEYTRHTREFSTSWNRRTFLRHNPKWRSAGVDRDVRRIQRTSTDWKSSRGSAFTGRTRRVLEEPARYHTEREYEYTGYETYTREVESRQCYSFGCYTFTYEKTVRQPVTHSYWASSRYHSSHDATGRTRRELVESAEYTTEYEHEYVSWDVDVTRTYEVEWTEQTQWAEYEWRHYDTVSDERVAFRMASDDPDLRVGDERTERVWTMVREDTELVVRPAYEDDFDVAETRATVRGDTVRYHTEGPSSEMQRDVLGTFEESFVGEGFVPREEIEDRAQNRSS